MGKSQLRGWLSAISNQLRSALLGVGLLLLACNGPIAIGQVTTEATAIPSVVPTTATPAGPPTPTLAPEFQPPPPTATMAPFGGERTIGDPYAPELGNGGYFVQSYRISLTLDPQAEAVDGFTEIMAISNQENLSQLSLDFVGFTVSSVQIAGVPAEFYREQRKLVITLPQAFDNGERFAILVVYAGQPVRERSAYSSAFSPPRFDLSRHRVDLCIQRAGWGALLVSQQ